MQQKELKYLTSNMGTIKISEPVKNSFLNHVQNEEDIPESGGVLLGRLIKDSKDIIIDIITVPTLGDKQKRNSFVRGAKMHQKIIDSVWEKSNGTCNYLGEWHTHPENYPSPSRIDIKDWKKHLVRNTFSSLFLYYIIVGIKEINVWEGNRRTLKIKKLKPVNI